MNFINNFNSFLNESKSVDILEKYLSKIDLSKDSLNDIFIDLIDDGFILNTIIYFFDSKGKKTGPLSSDRIPVIYIEINFIDDYEESIELDVEFFNNLSKSINLLSKLLKQFDMKLKTRIIENYLNIEIRFEKEVDNSIPTLNVFVEKFDSLLFKKFEKFIRSGRVEYGVVDGYIELNCSDIDIKEFGGITKNVLINVVDGFGLILGDVNSYRIWNYHISNSDGILFNVSESFPYNGPRINLDRRIRYRIENYT